MICREFFSRPVVTPAARGVMLPRSNPTAREEGRLLAKLGCSNLWRESFLSPSAVPVLLAVLVRGV